MRNVIFITLGLFIGMVLASAYDHYYGEGSQLSRLHAELEETKDELAELKNQKQHLANETTTVSSRYDQVAASNSDLQQQVEDLKKSAVAATINPLTMSGLMTSMFRNGGMQGQARIFLLQTRLNLTPDQAAKVKAALDADASARRQIMQKMFRNDGKINPADAAKLNTLDQTLGTILNPSQLAAYQQLQNDERDSRAETATSLFVNRVSPLLQLTEAQKNQAYSTIYEIQASAPDPTSLMTDPNGAAKIAAQAHATQAALAKVLTPAQMDIYLNESKSLSAAPGRLGGWPRY